MPATKAQLWHYAPFLRFLAPLMAGIIAQWYLQFSFSFLLLADCLAISLIIFYFFLSEKRKYQFQGINGISIHLFIFMTGSCLVWINDIRHNKEWIGKYPGEKKFVTLRLLEPLVEKQNSFKALADVQIVAIKNQTKKATGKVIIYFKKDSAVQKLSYGSQIASGKLLQEIKNPGNPGSFNYKQYCLMQDITHQVYFGDKDFIILPMKNKNTLKAFLFFIRESVVGTIKKFIPGEREQGLAEALLIGYKDDLDKNLVESYSNTGVVHIIAISGLHLGLIYWLLLLLTKPIKKKKHLAWLRCLIIVSSLWIFSLLAGGSPSVLRSAVMFTCIALGEVLNKKSSIYNTLALSAFILLAWNPFWLWDVGFQLSYSAVLSIIIFFRPIYNWFYFQNKILDALWKLNAVTLAAQVLTLPISIYHFHQFPVLFLFANLVAVPVSSLILIGEIILIAFSFIHPLAEALGWMLQKMILFMNNYVERLNNISFAVWNHLSLSIIQTAFLLAFVAGTSYWLMEKNRKALWPALICLFIFFVLRAISFTNANMQKELVVYNVPRHQAIDIIEGRKYWFVGDTDLQQDGFIRNFHLQPSRILHRIEPADQPVPALKNFELSNRKVFLIDSTIDFKPADHKPVADLVILSKNPKLYISNLNKALNLKQVVIDGSVPAWKAALWSKDCDSLQLPCHDVSEKGAFVMKLQ